MHQLFSRMQRILWRPVAGHFPPARIGTRAIRSRHFSSDPCPQSQQKTALVMGVANHRSIAWACVESLCRPESGYHQVVFTFQDETKQAMMDQLIDRLPVPPGTVVHAIPCQVETDLPRLFHEQIPEKLYRGTTDNNHNMDPDRITTKLDTIVHAIAYSPSLDATLSATSLEDFQTAHHISTYSLLETAKHAKHAMNSNLTHGSSGASITALSYLGAQRTVSNYGLMGPAKASLEACVRGLALELGHYQLYPENATESTATVPHSIRVNAVSAGPLRTLSSRGIPEFHKLYQSVEQTSPLKRNITPQEVADTVRFLATEGTGITGQVLYVDAGYSSVVPLA